MTSSPDECAIVSSDECAIISSDEYAISSEEGTTPPTLTDGDTASSSSEEFDTRNFRPTRRLAASDPGRLESGPFTTRVTTAATSTASSRSRDPEDDASTSISSPTSHESGSEPASPGPASPQQSSPEQSSLELESSWGSSWGSTASLSSDVAIADSYAGHPPLQLLPSPNPTNNTSEDFPALPIPGRHNPHEVDSRHRPVNTSTQQGTDGEASVTRVTERTSNRSRKSNTKFRLGPYKMCKKMNQRKSRSPSPGGGAGAGAGALGA